MHSSPARAASLAAAGRARVRARHDVAIEAEKLDAIFRSITTRAATG